MVYKGVIDDEMNFKFFIRIEFDEKAEMKSKPT